MNDVDGIDPSVPPSGPGCVECEGGGRLVVPSAPVRAVRAHRLLRRLPAKHATAHYRATGHPVIRVSSRARGWFWNYATEELYASGPDLAPPAGHPADQPVPGPAGRVPADWARTLR